MCTYSAHKSEIFIKEMLEIDNMKLEKYNKKLEKINRGDI
jgi:hypothetical protein